MASTRVFHFQDGKSSKFWQIDVDGSRHTVRYGRVGTAGQVQAKDFVSEADARRAAERLIAEKLRKGYAEVGGGVGTAEGEPAPESRTAPSAGAPAEASGAGAAGGAGADQEQERPVGPTPGVSESELGQAAAQDSVAAGPAAAGAGATPPGAVDLHPPRRLDLEPEDWFRATWRPWTPLRRPAPPPFDREEALSRLSGVRHNGHDWHWGWRWSDARIGASLSEEEALFWLSAFRQAHHRLTPEGLAQRLRAQNTDRLPPLSTMLSDLSKRNMMSHEVMSALGTLFPARTLIEGLLELDAGIQALRQSGQSDFPHLGEFVRGFGHYSVPYLPLEEIRELRSIVGAEMRRSTFPAQSRRMSYDTPPIAYWLGARLGAHAELLAQVEAWPDTAYSAADPWMEHYHQPQDLVLGLGSAELVEHHLRRLKLLLRMGERIRAFLAHTEYAALDLIRDSVQVDSRELASELTAEFGRVQAPEAAPLMLELTYSSKAPREARRWLEQNSEHALVGLVPAAAGRGRLADAAQEYLRQFSRRGGKELLAAALAEAPADMAARVRSAVLEGPEAVVELFDAASTPGWLTDVLAGVKLPRKASATWVQPLDLPPLVVEGRRLNDTQVALLLEALRRSTLEDSHLAVPAVKSRSDRSSRENFAWRLFEFWLSDGAPPKEKWAMLALGHLGEDTCALKLASLVRAWPGESQHARAVLGLECLRAIGTDGALMQIHGIAERISFKGLKAKANECMEAIARDRKLTRPELEDRIVPDCGLDAAGTCVFDYGPRRFQLVLGPDLTPMLKDAAGAVRPALPKPGVKDDAALAQQAAGAWKELKKQLTQVVKIQTLRLEQAMVTGRCWTREEFETLLVRHPLQGLLVRRLIWGALDGDGVRQATFRMTDDASYASIHDDLFDLRPYSGVEIAHPWFLSEDDRSAWGELLTDYEIVPPFPQMGRALYALETAELAGDCIQRFAGTRIPPQALVYTLDARGWQRGVPEDGGVFYSHSKPFYGADLTAIVLYDGVPAGYMEGWEDQAIEASFFVAGVHGPDVYPQHEQRVPLAAVPAVVASEVLNDLNLVAGKGR